MRVSRSTLRDAKGGGVVCLFEVLHTHRGFVETRELGTSAGIHSVHAACGIKSFLTDDPAGFALLSMSSDPVKALLQTSTETLPHAPLDLLFSYLTKDCSVDQFLKGLSSSLGKISTVGSTPAVTGFVSALDVASEASKVGTRYEKLAGRSLYFTVLPMSGDLVLALRWSFSFTGESWGLLITDKAKVDISCLFGISSPWLETMVHLALRPLRSLTRCLQVCSGDRAVGVHDEILKRATTFDAASNAIYFQNLRLFLTWEVARRWFSWEASSVPTVSRLAEIVEAWAPELTLTDLDKLVPDQFLKSLRRPSKFRRDGVYSSTTRQVIISRCSERSKPFSRGGEWDVFLHRNDPVVYESMPGENELKDHPAAWQPLWWWRSIPKWPSLMQEEFRDNWSRSAFLYQLRARLLPTRTWDIFQSSWFHLDVSQRAILYYFWPPEYPRGKHWRQGRIFGDNLAEHLFTNTVPDKNPASFSPQELKRWNDKFRPWKHDLQGQPLERTQRSIPKRAPDWELLEALDRDWFLAGGHVLSNAEIKRHGRASKLHSEACKEVGIPVHSPCVSGN